MKQILVNDLLPTQEGNAQAELLTEIIVRTLVILMGYEHISYVMEILPNEYNYYTFVNGISVFFGYEPMFKDKGDGKVKTLSIEETIADLNEVAKLFSVMAKTEFGEEKTFVRLYKHLADYIEEHKQQDVKPVAGKYKLTTSPDENIPLEMWNQIKKELEPLCSNYAHTYINMDDNPSVVFLQICDKNGIGDTFAIDVYGHYDGKGLGVIKIQNNLGHIKIYSIHPSDPKEEAVLKKCFDTYQYKLTPQDIEDVSHKRYPNEIYRVFDFSNNYMSSMIYNMTVENSQKFNTNLYKVKKYIKDLFGHYVRFRFFEFYDADNFSVIDDSYTVSPLIYDNLGEAQTAIPELHGAIIKVVNGQVQQAKIPPKDNAAFGYQEITPDQWFAGLKVDQMGNSMNQPNPIFSDPEMLKLLEQMRSNGMIPNVNNQRSSNNIVTTGII